MIPFVPVHQRFVHQAELRPEARFLVEPARSYGEVATQVRGLAASLQAAGVGPGERVALWLPKQEASIVAVFGALIIGGVYVPLDSSQPGPRALAILERAEPVVLITESRRLPQLSAAGFPGRVLCVDQPEWAAAIGAAPLAQTVVVQPESLAALLFTSGSTGVPKGVQITHGCLSNYIEWAIDEMQPGPEDVFSAHAGLHFDLSTFDLFASASVGAALWVIDDDDARNVMTLAAGLRRHQVSVWYSVPSVLDMLVSAGLLGAPEVAALRLVLFAGEVYPLPRLRALVARLRPEAALYNLYGPTETNVCTYFRLGQIDPERTQPVPIGRAIRDTRLIVLRDDGQPIAEGEEGMGELLVEGVCVTSGYWRHHEPTNADNHRIGRHATGDLVSWEGVELVYRGRKDRMVKINGYRVELGEIEAALGRHPAVAQVAVVLADIQGTPKLIAFHVPVDGSDGIGLLEMKRFVAERVPRYMIPHGIRRLDALPVTPNGKTDLARLRLLAQGSL